MGWATAYPFATASSGAFYFLLLLVAIPTTRRLVEPFFAHPVPPNQKYLAGFDPLRGIAAAMVAMGHCWWATYPMFASTQFAVPWLAYSTKWVSIFAVLSGFLIYRSGISAIRSYDGLRAYVIRRFFRVYPVYALGVLLCLALSQYSGNPNVDPVSYFFSDLFMFPVLSWPGGFANPPAWSLYVEVAFYAALPLALVVVGQRRVVLICGLGIAAMVLADNQSRVYALWKYFLFGMAASEISPTLSRRAALLLGAAGIALLVLDFNGPRFDWAAKLGIGIKHQDEQTIGLGLGISMFLAALPHLKWLSSMLSVLPFRILGVISYSVYITQFFYIYANVPEIGLFTNAGTQDMYKHFSQMPSYSGWYLPLVFFPGAIFWGAVSFLIVERPGMMFGHAILKRRRQEATQPAVQGLVDSNLPDKRAP